ncbi:hypothetical protein OROHE_013417 [Orobanche hederae]
MGHKKHGDDSLRTQFVNETEWCISLQDDKGSCILSDLNPGMRKIIKLKEVGERNRARRCVDQRWKIGVLRDGQFVNINITAFYLLNFPRITFKQKTCIVQGGNKLLMAEATDASFWSDMLFRYKLGSASIKNWLWDRREAFEIAIEEEGTFEPSPPVPEYRPPEVPPRVSRLIRKALEDEDPNDGGGCLLSSTWLAMYLATGMMQERDEMIYELQ